MLLAAIIFVIIGIIVKHGKMYGLIAGYNTLPVEEQKKYDIEKIATLLRNVMFGMATIIILGYLGARYFDYTSLEYISFFGALIVGIPYLLIMANSKKYKV